ncbi:MAG: helix-turn-helix transcriptional regulator [Liquorilactobacillus ghanensis]|uniref:helix-turn-helix transcriptional regulator n=1 Tax=Liquorilactobacillus ghanensis TaxID=399370 RepID=UPI0039E9E33D
MSTKLPHNLKILREQKHLKQNELAAELNVSRQTVSSWETGRNTPDIDTLIRLAHFYQISLNELVSDQLDPAQHIDWPSKKVLGLLFIILFIERITVDAPWAARMWIDCLLWFPAVIAEIMLIIEHFQLNLNIDQFIYSGGLGLFSFVAILSSWTNLFSMGFGFQTVCFACGLIATAQLIYFHVKTHYNIKNNLVSKSFYE